MGRQMFEYSKEILKKVSFDVTLFCKELQKALTRLLPHEVEELRHFVLGLVEKNPDLSYCMFYIEE